MENIKDKLLELFRILVYGFAVFGVIMFAAYYGVLYSPDRSYIPMMFISQIIYFTIGTVIAIALCLSDIILKNSSMKVRIVIFFITLYIVGIVFFQFRSSIQPFNNIGNFLLLSLLILNQTLIVLGVWFGYSKLTNNKYDKCLQNYKKNLKC